MACRHWTSASAVRTGSTQYEFLVLFRAVHPYLQQEAVFLGLRQGIGALILDRVLRREDRKIGGQGIGLAIDGHVTFLHGLQQGALGLGGRPVDLVRQQEGREDGALHEGEGVFLHIEDVRPDDVGRHEVRRELNSPELAAQHLGQRADQQRLRHAGHAFDQGVLPREYRHQGMIHHGLLADDDLRYFAPGALQHLVQLLDTVIQRSGPFPSGGGWPPGHDCRCISREISLYAATSSASPPGCFDAPCLVSINRRTAGPLGSL